MKPAAVGRGDDADVPAVGLGEVDELVDIAGGRGTAHQHVIAAIKRDVATSGGGLLWKTASRG